MVTATDLSGAERKHPRKSFVPTYLVTVFLVCVDVLVTVGTGLAAGLGYYYAYYGILLDGTVYLQQGTLLCIFFIIIQFLKNEYRHIYTHTDGGIFKSCSFDWNIAFIVFILVGFLTKTTDTYSRGFVVIFYVLGFVTVAGVRIAIARGLRKGLRDGWLVANRVLLVGLPSEVRRFEEHYDSAQSGLRIADVVTVPQTLDELPGDERSATVERAIARARDLNVEEILLLLPWSGRAIIDRYAEAFLAVPASIYLGPEHDLERFGDIGVSKLGDAVCFRLARAPLSRGKRVAKRLFDIATAATALTLLSPLLLLIGVLIRLDSPGPALFFQRRLGFNNRVFRIVKFRTMATMEDGAIRQATANDPRVTRVGRFLRRWNIDELPQLFNVLAGTMSIVGPRPHALMHNDEYQQKIARYARRHNVKPGITGWAQINGLRGETDRSEKMQARVEHDLFYIDNWSLWFDAYIIMMTLISPRAYRNAH